MLVSNFSLSLFLVRDTLRCIVLQMILLDDRIFSDLDGNGNYANLLATENV